MRDTRELDGVRSTRGFPNDPAQRERSLQVWSKAFRRSVLEAITLEEDRFGFEPEITAKISKLQVRIYEVGISYYGRTYSEGKKIGWKDGVRAIWCILKHNLFR